GVGINVRTTGFPPELAARATSLALCGASSTDLKNMFVELASMLFRRLEALRNAGPPAIVEAFNDLDVLAGRAITVDGAPAVALGVASDGALRIRRADGTETTFIAGEVELRREVESMS